MLQKYGIILKYGNKKRLLFALPLFMSAIVAYSQADTVVRPRLVSVGILSPAEIIVRFNKPVIPDNDMISCYNPDVVAVEWDRTAGEAVLALNHELDSLGIEKFDIRGLSCIDGCRMSDTVIEVSLPRKAQYMDIVINEIMPYVDSTQSKYIEILNATDYFFDLAALCLCNPDSTGKPKNTRRLTAVSTLLAPHRLAVAVQKLHLLHTRRGLSGDAVYLEAKMPSFAAASGEIWLCDTACLNIDKLQYTKKMHNSALRDLHNVSLERLSAVRATNDAANWHSASTGCGYNTAGWPNSQLSDGSSCLENLSFTCPVPQFSPNGDGYNDLLVINYRMPSAGYILTADIYTRTGSHVSRIIDRHLLALQGTYTWDGKNSGNMTVESGLYVMVLQAASPEGRVTVRKIVFSKL